MTTPAHDLERLASLIALLTSEEGEAENAGRAAGQLARRMGLSGGQLKAIFVTGLRAAGIEVPAPAEPEAETPEPEVLELRRLLDRSDAQLQSAEQRVSELEDENETLRGAADRARAAGWVLRLALLAVLAAAAIGVGLAWLGPEWTAWTRPAPVAQPGEAGRVAVVGERGTTLRRQPEPDAAALGRLPAGARIPVRRLLWRGFAQWVETESGGAVAYVPATEIDLR